MEEQHIIKQNLQTLRDNLPSGKLRSWIGSLLDESIPCSAYTLGVINGEIALMLEAMP